MDHDLEALLDLDRPVRRWSPAAAPAPAAPPGLRETLAALAAAIHALELAPRPARALEIALREIGLRVDGHDPATGPADARTRARQELGPLLDRLEDDLEALTLGIG
jgi:hypothetical protein